jgi:hypothetical protein
MWCLLRSLVSDVVYLLVLQCLLIFKEKKSLHTIATGKSHRNIVTAGFHVTTAIMIMTNTMFKNTLDKRMNSSVVRFRHIANDNNVLCAKEYYMIKYS